MDDSAGQLARIAGLYIEALRHDLDVALRDVGGALEDGRAPTADEVEQARKQLDFIRTILEHELAPLADDTEPWERPPDVPYGVARDMIDPDREYGP